MLKREKAEKATSDANKEEEKEVDAAVNLMLQMQTGSNNIFG